MPGWCERRDYGFLGQSIPSGRFLAKSTLSRLRFFAEPVLSVRFFAEFILSQR